MRERYVELLAPAGTFEALEAAVNAGADAVYMGGKAFGARAYAENFDDEAMRRAVRFAHLHKVRLFITVNTLVDDSEMDALARYLIFLHNIKVDGIIVQDLGVVNVAKKIAPALPLHASTQMTLTSSAAVEFSKNAGMERSVLARELSLGEIEKICRECGTEIEAFIHGALCVCYSGQCLMSSLIGARSGNRGRCAQPCRLPYNLVNADGADVLKGKEAGQFLLSPRDFNTLDILPKLIEAGVTSYKIEGRMKRPEYVAVVVDAYRRAIDSYKSGHFEIPENDRKNIEQIFNRDFTTAYLEHRPGRTMMSDRRPNNRGVLVGRVTKINKGAGTGVIKLERDLHVGDGLEFWVSVGGRVGETLGEIIVRGEKVERAIAGQQATIVIPRGVRLNDRVFRTLDSELMTYAATFYGEKNKKRIPIDVCVEARVGQSAIVTATDPDGNVGVGKTDFIVEPARKHPLGEAAAKKQIDRLGATEYTLRSLTLKADDDVMVPLSELNEARRLACEALDAARLAAFEPQRNILPEAPDKIILPVVHPRGRGKCTPLLTVWTDELPQAKAALEAGADWLIFGGDRFHDKDVSFADYAAAAKLARGMGRRFAFSTPRIVKESQLPYFQKFLAQCAVIRPDILCVHNLSMLTLARRIVPELPWWADMSLNNYNSQTLDVWRQFGAVGATLSVELNMAQVEKLARVSPLPLECLAQGPIEMMVSEYCAPGSFLGELDRGECKWRCRQELYLKDRREARFRLAGDQFCRMHVLNSLDLSVLTSVPEFGRAGVERLRIDARTYDAERTAELTAAYKAALLGDVPEENLPHTTRGHYYRGVL